MKVLLSESSEEAAERVRKRDGDRSITAMVDRVIHASDRGPCATIRGDGRPCGAPTVLGLSQCEGCNAFAPVGTMRTTPGIRATAAAERRAKRKGARS